MKISNKDQNTLLEKFKARPAAPTQPVRPDIDFTKQLERNGNKVEATLRADVGTIDEGTANQFLKDEGLNPEEWEITGFRKSQWDGFSGPMESVRFNFRRKESLNTELIPDLNDLHESVKKSRTKKKPKTTNSSRSIITGLADLQIGKTDILGGTQELLERLEDSLERWRKFVRYIKPEEILICDTGDILENFNNVASQAQTNDLRLTEQIRVARRVLWAWIDEAASLAPSIKVAGVPSNHARIRKGKDYLSEPFDDYGIENIATLSDMAKVYPEKYSHVEFYTPDKLDDSLAIPTKSGIVVGMHHGDAVSNPNSLDKWLAGQALNRSAIGYADIVIVGHWHHLFVKSIGKNQTLFICPTADNGSSWYRNKSGNETAPGVLSIVVDPDKPYGWDGPHIF